jgi:cell division protein FtsI/penicillin-binding protein 2
MSTPDKNLNIRIYIVALIIFLMAAAIVLKLTNIQWVHGAHYRELGKKHDIKIFELPANRGNIYSADGSLLATSVPIYEVRFDAVSPSDKDFKLYVKPLSDSLSKMFGGGSSFFESKLNTARERNNQFMLLAKDLSYTEYSRLKSFPLLKLGTYKGGRIDSITEIRKHPIGEIAQRTIGYIGLDKNGKPNAVGLEGAFGKYLSGKDGRVLKQKIAQGQYKPIKDNNEIDPVDGYDVISTLDVYIQDIAHHALLKSLTKYKAEHVYENYKNNPHLFIDRINKMGLNKPLGLAINGEASPFVPQPGTPRWNGMSLPWMAFGYGIEVTPMQTLTLYNAIANNGEMIKPLFVSEIKEWNKTIKKFEKEVINPKICSDSTIKKLKAVMQNVVKIGTAKKIYSKDFSMAGKTGTAQGNYGINGGANKHYISSFVGFFPVDKPKYTCIVVVHKPSTVSGNFYGADVAAPVFKRIAQKIFTDAPSTNEIKNVNKKINTQENNYDKYYSVAQNEKNVVPNVKGMPAMDAIALLETLGLKVKLKKRGIGKVKSQSIPAGNPIKRKSIIELTIS